MVDWCYNRCALPDSAKPGFSCLQHRHPRCMDRVANAAKRAGSHATKHLQKATAPAVPLTAHSFLENTAGNSDKEVNMY